MKTKYELENYFYKYNTDTYEYQGATFGAYRDKAVITATGAYFNSVYPFVVTSVEIKNGPYDSSSAVNPYIGSPRIVANINGTWYELCRFASISGSNVIKTYETGLTKPYTLFGLRADSKGDSANDLMRITYTIYRGYYLYPEKSTVQDYDFTRGASIIKPLETSITRDYYKYSYSAWTRPTLTSNGILGRDSFAVWADSEYNTSNYQAWGAMNGNYTTNTACWVSGNGKLTASYIFYNPYPLNVTNLRITNRNDTYTGVIRSGTVEASTNMSSWDTLKTFTNDNVTKGSAWNIDLSNNSNYYKYYRITGTSTANYVSIQELDITATERRELTGTASNYDFYRDINHYNFSKDWRIGEYYGT